MYKFVCFSNKFSLIIKEKFFYENIENLFIQETKKFLLSVNIIKEFYYGLQSEILKSVILPFTSQIENIDINSIFKEIRNKVVKHIIPVEQI